jgi:hypothetical protein
MRVGLGALAAAESYDDYRRRLDPRRVLERYGAENCREVPGSGGTTEVVHSCLLDRVEPHHANGDQSPSACLNLDRKLYVCYGYWGGDLLHLVMKMERKDSVAEVAHVLSGLLAGAVMPEDDLLAVVRRLTEDQLARWAAPGGDLPAYSERVLSAWSRPHPWMVVARGVSIEAQELLRIGHDPVEDRIVFPHFWSGQLVGWQKRALPTTAPDRGGGLPKYRSSTGFPKSETLYGYDLARAAGAHAVVVESPMSVAKAHSLGLPGVVATFGAGVSARQAALLREFRSVTVWTDDDPAGRAAERKLVAALSRHVAVRVVSPDAGRDLADCSDASEAGSKLDAAQPAALVEAKWMREGARDARKR